MNNITHLPRIVIRMVEPDNQRYPTCGDWLYDAEDHVLEIRISKMADYRSEMAVAMHEFYEAVECLNANISETTVTAFDLKFEDERIEGKHGENDEPGDDDRAPYIFQHAAATLIEKTVCAQAGLLWENHEANVYNANELQG